MPRQPVRTLHAICAALVMAVAMPAFAQQKPASLVGITREQVLARLGEPKSNITAGSREMLFFPHLKVTLRNGVVIETEELADEPAPRRAPDPTTATSASSAAAPSANTNQPAPQHDGVAPAPTNPEAANQLSARPAPEAGVAPAKPTPPPEPPLEIKLVKPGSSSARSAPPPAASVIATPEAAKPAPVAATAASPLPATPAPTPTAKPTESAVMANRPAVMPEAEHTAAAEEVSPPDSDAAKPAAEPKKKAATPPRSRSHRDSEIGDEPVEIFSTQSYVIAAFVMIAGGWYLWWRRAQRNLALEATAVSRTPFEAVAAADTTGQFTADLVGKLGEKRFERLVASYYAKTGVVAERTNAAPGTPVHIKIFWKGEPKPFAGVQCHANPPALIGAKPLQELFDALSAADIRRGYVVTTGKFNVEARDYAEEKHFTLLSGDIFLEKLNALPPAARGELLKETNTEESAASAPGGAVA